LLEELKVEVIVGRSPDNPTGTLIRRLLYEIWVTQRGDSATVGGHATNEDYAAMSRS
jgi:histidinol-phosphate/aromatic aminotransferase/cobyric acid decarboxylase-like protein